MITDSEYLERVVAGINARAHPTANVQWNLELAGRQFDVVMDFKAGPYKFLILIEVKNWTRNISAEAVEAFVTKAKDKNANKIVFVAKGGFQSGAIEVAKRHGVDLFQVSFALGNLSENPARTIMLLRQEADGTKHARIVKSMDEVASRVSFGAPIKAVMIRNCKLTYIDGSIAELPTEPTQMEYYAHKSKFLDGETLDQKIDKLTATLPNNASDVLRVHFSPPMPFRPPDEFFIRSGPVTSIAVRAEEDDAIPLSGTARIDPSLIPPKVEYENVLTGEKLAIDASLLPVAADLLEPGKFYFQLYPLRYFYCDNIKNNIATIYLVESFQCGELFRTTFTQNIQYSYYYIRETDSKTLARLRERLGWMKAREDK